MSGITSAYSNSVRTTAVSNAHGDWIVTSRLEYCREDGEVLDDLVDETTIMFDRPITGLLDTRGETYVGEFADHDNIVESLMWGWNPTAEDRRSFTKEVI